MKIFHGVAGDLKQFAIARNWRLRSAYSNTNNENSSINVGNVNNNGSVNNNNANNTNNGALLPTKFNEIRTMN